MNGWVVLVIVMMYVVENEWIVFRLFRAVRRVFRSDASAEFVEEDLIEFVNLFIVYVCLELRLYVDVFELVKVYVC